MEKERLSLRFSKRGYYGPGGFGSQFHIAGPLVLGTINPAGDPLVPYCKNNLDDNTQIGSNFDKNKFIEFVKKTIMDFTSASNLIISKEQYENLRNFVPNN
ncbi:hypothetical protein [Chryseobacterium oranimense]|uniref:hypothetical protein n=1 Tax=Chryseobacterium oranimense TaxID=421058 RepID=UPI0031D32E9C